MNIQSIKKKKKKLLKTVYTARWGVAGFNLRGILGNLCYIVKASEDVSEVSRIREKQLGVAVWKRGKFLSSRISY